MRIAIVTETFLPRVDGIVRMLLAFLAYLDEHDHQALVFAPGKGECLYRGATVVRVRGLPFPLYPDLVVAPYSTRMARMLREWRPDLIHLAGPFVLGAHGLAIGRSLGVPVAAHYQTDIARYAEHFGLGALASLAWRRLRDLHNASDVTFAPTPGVAGDLQARGMARVHVCGRGVDTALFNPARRDQVLRQRITGGTDRPILLYVGRISPEKNLGVLVTVARLLPDYPLLIVGDGPARGPLAADLAGLNVHFTGTLSGTDLATAYASSDVFLFPSTTETFGQVVREAMASGLPVAGMAAGGIRDVIHNGTTGVLCSPDDQSTFVATARFLGENSQVRQRLGRAARQEAEKHTWTAVFDHLMGWYGGLVSSRQEMGATARHG